jgi:hypothetical protein
MRSGLYQKITRRVAFPLNTSAPSLASRLLPILYNKNFADLDIDVILYALDPLSCEHKQRRDSLLHEYTSSRAHLTTRQHRREEGTSGRLSSQISAHRRQGGREGLGSHDGQMKSSAQCIYS